MDRNTTRRAHVNREIIFTSLHETMEYQQSPEYQALIQQAIESLSEADIRVLLRAYLKEMRCRRTRHVTVDRSKPLIRAGGDRLRHGREPP